jgi:TonB family protein
MKKSILITGLFFFVLAGNAQHIRFEHTGGRAAIVSKSKLEAARFVSDVAPDVKKLYKAEINVGSVEISGSVDGRIVSSAGQADELNAAQKNILTGADMGTEINIKVTYSFAGATAPGGDTSPRSIEYALTPGPEIEAQFPGGKEEMTRYMTEQVINKFDDKITLENLARASICFVVNENGQITQPSIYRSTGNSEVDKAVITAISQMPAWKPAEYSKGIRIKQKFIVSLSAQPEPKPQAGGKGC